MVQDFLVKQEKSWMTQHIHSVFKRPSYSLLSNQHPISEQNIISGVIYTVSHRSPSSQYLTLIQMHILPKNFIFFNFFF